MFYFSSVMFLFSFFFSMFSFKGKRQLQLTKVNVCCFNAKQIIVNVYIQLLWAI